MQKIYFGAPGTGKSYEIDQFLNKNGVEEENVFRVTFHPEYTYNDFVGQLIPKMEKLQNGETVITYSFEKGQFTLALEKAYEDISKPVYLIIEEMSRGNCAAIFGDIFQLLDRVSSGTDKGFSRYFINNAIIAKDIIALTDDRVKLPPNLSILGTVNTSDQNVFVMDTAFKRRFEWEYISTKPVPKEKPYKNNVDIVLNNGKENINIKWVDLYGVLNKFITSEKWLDLGEDKQIGQFFIEFIDPLEYQNQIKNKLLNYLWFDILQASYKSDVRLFDESISSFSDLYDKFDRGEKVFSDDFFNCIESWKNNAL